MIYQVEQLKRLGQGCSKIVFQHPIYPSKVIKIMNPTLIHNDGGFKKHNKIKRQFAQGAYRQFRREFIQYLQLCKNHYKNNRFIFPVETIYELVHTDQGLGLVVEKIISPNGEGLTLNDLCNRKEFGDKHAQALDSFFDACCDLHIIFGEVNISGIMYTEERNNKPEFVLVDGMGEKLFLPLRAMSKKINAYNVRKVESKIKNRMQEILSKA